MMYGNNAPQKPMYSEIVGYFQQNQVSRYDLDLGNGKLEIWLRGVDYSDPKNRTIKYTVPDVGLFLSNIDEIVTAYNTENPDDPIEYDCKKPSEIPWLL